MRSPGASPCIKYGVSTAGSQALLAARNEQLMIGAGQPVSWHGSAGPSMQDSDMRSEGGVLHRVHPLHFSDDAVPASTWSGCYRARCRVTNWGCPLFTS